MSLWLAVAVHIILMEFYVSMLHHLVDFLVKSLNNDNRFTLRQLRAKGFAESHMNDNLHVALAIQAVQESRAT